MKKKFVLTLALVLMVAATLVAATPIEVSGEFSAGYDFAFASGSTGTTHAAGADLDTVFTFTGDFWKLTVKGGTDLLADGTTATTANADIYLDKAFAAEGVDMGDVSLTLHMGTGVGGNVQTVSANVKDDAPWKKKAVGITNGNNFGLTLGYASLGSLYVTYDPVDGKAFAAGVKASPVDGVDATVGFTNAFGGAQNALLASVAADIAKLADLDFALKTTVEYVVELDPTVHKVLADVAGSYEGIGLWVAYASDIENYHALAARASYSTKVEDIDLSAGVTFQVKDLSDFDGTYDLVVDAGAGYDFGGVSYALDAKYELQAKTFTLSPSVTISF